jgi:nucleotide-binding universal stress UspA family protein
MDSEMRRWRRFAIGVSLIVFFIAVYFFTYCGYAISRDEWFLFDATESMARRDNLEQNYEFDAYPPFSLKNAQPPSADTEPLQPILAAPLFLIAQAVPGLGLAHTVWAFNVLITALTVGTFYAYSLALGYRVQVAVLAALMLGLGTIIWPYSRTFFREPLFTWLTLLSAYLMMCLRRQVNAGNRAWRTGIALVFALAGALLSKEASLLLVPVIMVEALPARLGKMRVTRRKIVILTALVLFAVVAVVAVLNIDILLNITNRYAFVSRLRQARQNFSGMFEGVKGYMVSPGRSLWIFSPVLVVGFFGLNRLARQRRWRQIAVPLVMLVTYTLGYALVRGPERWTGGLGWGARYLVPVVPFLALWLLPVVESLQHTAWWKRLGVGAVFLLSAGVQVLVTELESDLIVMCTHGQGGLRRWLFGSIAQQVLSLGTSPVLLIQPDKSGNAPAFSCRRLLVPLDGDPEHEQGLPVAARLAQIRSSALHLVMVVRTRDTLSGERASPARLLPATMSALLDMTQQGAEEYLNRHVTRLQAEGLSVTASVGRGAPATVITRTAQQINTDLIVLGTHGKTGMDAFWSGSVTPRIFGRAHVPLLLVRVHKSEYQP